jgi:glyoxylase-like metal-dependent hydrolase (beta-lactamase superfamily II)
MKIVRVTYGPAASNTYLAGAGEGGGGGGVLIDAGASPEAVQKAAAKHGIRPELILLTHCHYDHIEYLDELREAFGIRAAIHAGDAPGIADEPLRNGSYLFGSQKRFRAADEVLEDGQVVEAGGLRLTTLHTPGHSPGGACFLCGTDAFTGDTLFQGSIGRTDLGLGDYERLLASIHEKLLPLPDGTRIHPGHGYSSTVGEERAQNPFLR